MIMLWLFPALIFIAAGDRDAKRLRRIFGRTISSTSISIRNTSLVERGKSNTTSAMPGGWETGNRNVVVTSKLAPFHLNAFITFLDHHLDDTKEPTKAAIRKAREQLTVDKRGRFVINSLTFTERMISLSHLASAFIIICINSDQKPKHTNDYQGFVFAGGAIDTALDNIAMAPLRLGTPFSKQFFQAYDKMHFAQFLASLFGWGLRSQDTEKNVKGLQKVQKEILDLKKARNKETEDLAKTDTPELTSEEKADALLRHVRLQTDQTKVEKLWIKFRKYVGELEFTLDSCKETNICCKGGVCPEREGGGMLYGKDKCPDLEQFYVSLTKVDSAYDNLINPVDSATKYSQGVTIRKTINYLTELVKRCEEGFKVEYSYEYDIETWTLLEQFCDLGKVPSKTIENAEGLKTKCTSCEWDTATDITTAKQQINDYFHVADEMSLEQKKAYKKEMLKIFELKNKISHRDQLDVRTQTETFFKAEIGTLLK